MPGFDSLARQVKLLNVLVSPAGLPGYDHLRWCNSKKQKSTQEKQTDETKYDKRITKTTSGKRNRTRKRKGKIENETKKGNTKGKKKTKTKKEREK